MAGPTRFPSKSTAVAAPAPAREESGRPRPPLPSERASRRDGRLRAAPARPGRGVDHRGAGHRRVAANGLVRRHGATPAAVTGGAADSAAGPLSPTLTHSPPPPQWHSLKADRRAKARFSQILSNATPFKINMLREPFRTAMAELNGNIPLSECHCPPPQWHSLKRERHSLKDAVAGLIGCPAAGMACLLTARRRLSPPSPASICRSAFASVAGRSGWGAACGGTPPSRP